MLLSRVWCAVSVHGRSTIVAAAASSPRWGSSRWKLMGLVRGHLLTAAWSIKAECWRTRERHQRVPLVCLVGNWKWPRNCSMSFRGCWLVFLTSCIFQIPDGCFCKNFRKSMLGEGKLSGDCCKKDLEIVSVCAPNQQVQKSSSALINWTVQVSPGREETRDCYFGDCYKKLLIRILFLKSRANSGWLRLSTYLLKYKPVFTK